MAERSQASCVVCVDVFSITYSLFLSAYEQPMDFYVGNTLGEAGYPLSRGYLSKAN